jgi:hypothetical protein
MQVLWQICMTKSGSLLPLRHCHPQLTILPSKRECCGKYAWPRVDHSTAATTPSWLSTASRGGCCGKCARPKADQSSSSATITPRWSSTTSRCKWSGKCARSRADQCSPLPQSIIVDHPLLQVRVLWQMFSTMNGSLLPSLLQSLSVDPLSPFKRWVRWQIGSTKNGSHLPLGHNHSQLTILPIQSPAVAILSTEGRLS